MRPHISVIITEYKPRGFLKYAVRSVFNQTLDKGLYEAVVVKRFRDAYVDRYVEGNGGKVILLDDAPIGQYLYVGIQESEGEVISFLDDDAFVGRKLEYIHRLFNSNPDIGYYHHLAYVIDSRNNVVGRFFGGPRIRVLMDPRDRRMIKSAVRRFGLIGSLMSVTVVRREVISPYINKLRSLITGQDTFMFLSALSSRYLVLHEPLELSFYRVHGDQVSLPRGSSSLDILLRFSRSAVLNQHGFYFLNSIFPQLSYVPLRHNPLGAYHYNVLGLIILGLSRRLVASTGFIVLWRGLFDKSIYRVMAGLLGFAHVILPRKVVQDFLIRYYGARVG